MTTSKSISLPLAVREKAADLWCEMLVRPKFQAIAPGERDKSMEMASVLAGMLPNNSNTDTLSKFKTALTKALETDPPIYLDVDYEPDPMLSMISFGTER